MFNNIKKKDTGFQKDVSISKFLNSESYLSFFSIKLLNIKHFINFFLLLIAYNSDAELVNYNGLVNW